MGEKFIAPNHDLLQYSGRIDTTEEGPVLIYPCSFVKIRFTGSSLKIIIYNKNKYWNNYLGSIIDGKQERTLLSNDTKEVITLAQNLGGQVHTALIFKRMDSCHTLQILGFYIEEGEELVECDAKPERKIEFYGDSVTAGEVSEAIEYVGRPDPSHQGEYSNSWYSYAWITARNLDAQIHNVSQGGIALLNNTGWFYESNYIGLESIYDKTSYHPELGEIKDWDFTNYTPHVVVLAIGQNDSHPYDYIKENYEGEQSNNWREHYKEFVKKIRMIYPYALIILATTILEHDVNWDHSIEEVYRDLKDDKIVHFLYSNNGKGTPGHIRIEEAERMAEELTSFIQSFGDDIWI
jgi:Carbohydrate esterase 2 N-terminal